MSHEGATARSSGCPSPAISENIHDLCRDFLSLHQKHLLPQLDEVLDHALKENPTASSSSSSSPSSTSTTITKLDAMFQSWCERFGVAPLADYAGARTRLAAAVPRATEEDVLISLVRAEMRGFAESDARRSLEKQYGISRPRGMSLTAPITKKPSSLNADFDAAPSSLQAAPHFSGSEVVKSPLNEEERQTTNPIDEEVRDWLLALVPPTLRERLATSPNVVDALRDGVILSVLLQKVSDPPVQDCDLKIPKRTDGFFARDNVAAFLQQINKRFSSTLPQELMLNLCDLCDGKNDGAVVTFLLNVARSAMKAGFSGPLPEIVKYDADIDKQHALITEAEVEAAISSVAADVEIVPSAAVSGSSDAVRGATRGMPLPPKTRPIVVSTTVMAEEEDAHVPSSGLPEPAKPVDRVISQAIIATAVNKLRDDAGATLLRYVPRNGDDIDTRVGEIVNRTLYGISSPVASTSTAGKRDTCIKRLSHDGAYVVYHRITGKKQVIHVRVVRKTVMLRVGGGWECFEPWLSRHSVTMGGEVSGSFK